MIAKADAGFTNECNYTKDKEEQEYISYKPEVLLNIFK